MTQRRASTAATIRPEQPADTAAIAAVVEAAFGSPVEARLVDDIRRSPEYEPDWSLVAEVDGEIVGHVMVSRAALHDGEEHRRIAMLSPLAVTPAAQRRGIGSALVRAVARRVDDAGEPCIILEGSPAYYGRLGFEAAAPYGIRIPLPGWAPPEAAQVLRL
ncbi:MAG: GNAT family N-acetyltransferase, partial [Acidimicrobiia bacterium]